MYWIYDLSSERMAALFAVGFVGFSWFGAIFLRPFLRPFVRATGGVNDVVGYILSCFCVFYGLLIGLLAVAAYQNYTAVEASVTREAAAIAALYRDVSSYPSPHNVELQRLLREYTRYVIEEAWPHQQKGRVPAGGTERATAFQERLLAFQPGTKAEEILHAETLRQFNVFIEYRRMRLFSVTTGVPAVMWYVVILGAVLNIALVWLFDMRLISHLFLGGILAFFLGSMVFLIAAMDNPFRGEVSIPPDSYRQIFEHLMSK